MTSLQMLIHLDIILILKFVVGADTRVHKVLKLIQIENVLRLLYIITRKGNLKVSESLWTIISKRLPLGLRRCEAIGLQLYANSHQCIP